MDTTRSILYRGLLLNDEDLAANADPGDGLGEGMAGCVVDDFDPDDVDVVQFKEKRAETDGMDVGNPFLGGRRIRLDGTMYGKTRALCYDLLFQMRKVLNPVLAAREIPGDKGYLPMYFSVPTNRIADFPAGAIDMRALVMPKVFRAPINRDSHGGTDDDGLAITWSAVFEMRDPNFEGDTPQDVAFANSTSAGGPTSGAVAATDLFTVQAHGFNIGDRIFFTRLVGGTGVLLNTSYYVISASFDSNHFKVSTTPGGGAVNITVDYTRAEASKYLTFSGNFNNRGTYNAPLNMLLAVSAQAGTITVSAGGSNFTITIPATTDPAFTGATATASTDLINKTAHGLVSGDRVTFTTLTGGTGLVTNNTYYVIASGLTADVFKVSSSLNGSAEDITADYSTVAYSKASYRLLRFKREKVFTVEENGIETIRRSWLTFQNATTWPLIPEGVSGYTVTVNGTMLDPGSVDGSHMWYWEMYA